MVYVGNLPFKAEWQELKDHMKQCGAIEFCNVMTMDGSMWGRSRGIGYVRYSSAAEAEQAIATLNGSMMGDRAITVDPWTGADPELSKGKGMKGKGGMPSEMQMMMAMGKGGKGGFGGKGGYDPWLGKGGYGFEMFGKGGKGFMPVKMHGEAAQMVYVSNLAWKTAWQDLKTHMKQAGQVEFVKILTADGTEFGRSRGQACVRYSSESEALNAIQMLNDTDLMGRPIKVDRWTQGKSL